MSAKKNGKKSYGNVRRMIGMDGRRTRSDGDDDAPPMSSAAAAPPSPPPPPRELPWSYQFPTLHSVGTKQESKQSSSVEGGPSLKRLNDKWIAETNVAFLRDCCDVTSVSFVFRLMTKVEYAKNMRSCVDSFVVMVAGDVLHCETVFTVVERPKARLTSETDVPADKRDAFGSTLLANRASASATSATTPYTHWSVVISATIRGGVNAGYRTENYHDASWEVITPAMSLDDIRRCYNAQVDALGKPYNVDGSWNIFYEGLCCGLCWVKPTTDEKFYCSELILVSLEGTSYQIDDLDSHLSTPKTLLEVLRAKHAAVTKRGGRL